MVPLLLKVTLLEEQSKSEKRDLLNSIFFFYFIHFYFKRKHFYFTFPPNISLISQEEEGDLEGIKSVKIKLGPLMYSLRPI